MLTKISLALWGLSCAIVILTLIGVPIYALWKEWKNYEEHKEE